MKRVNLFFLLSLLWVISPPLLAAERSVEARPFSELALSKTLQFPASVVNLQMADIAAETSGRILRFPLQVGDRVQQGDSLLEIDCTLANINKTRAEAGLKRLRATRDLTRQQLQRAERLLASRSISREELDQRQTQLAADNASIEEQQALLASAEQAVRDCRLQAPYSGTVIEKLSSVGAYVTPGAPVLRLLEQDQVELELQLGLDQIDVLQQADDLQFVSSGKSYPLRIRSILPRINPQSLQQPVRLSFTGTEPPPGGSYGLVSFSTDKIYLPSAYVQKRQGQFGVFIALDQQAIFIPLPNAEEGQSVATDLDPAALVITSQLQLLKHQDSISLSQ